MAAFAAPPFSRLLPGRHGLQGARAPPPAVSAASRRVRVAAGPGKLPQASVDEVPLDRFDRCELVDAFCRTAVEQQGRPRANVYSFTEPSRHGTKTGGAGDVVFPAWCEPMQSLDSADIIDWSDTENDGWGLTAQEADVGRDSANSSSSNGKQDFSSSSGGSGGGGGARPGSANAVAAARGAARVATASSLQAVVWGGSMRQARGMHALGCSSSSSSRRSPVAAHATPRPDAAPAAAEGDNDARGVYEGAIDSDEAMFPAGSLEMDDPGHPAEVNAGAGLDQQAAVVRPEKKPFMNIVNGRWVPPSKADANHMLGMLSTMGPDEGV